MLNVVSGAESKLMVKESTTYKNWMGELTTNAPVPQAPEKSLLRDTLTVHIKDLKAANDFARLIGRPLDSKSRRFDLPSKKHPAKECVYTEMRAEPLKVKTTHKTRLETKLWGNLTDFTNDPDQPYIDFEINLRDESDLVTLTKIFKKALAPNTTSIWYPPTQKADLAGLKWVSKFDDKLPRHPIYIVSKGSLTQQTKEAIAVAKAPKHKAKKSKPDRKKVDQAMSAIDVSNLNGLATAKPKGKGKKARDTKAMKLGSAMGAIR